MTHKVYYKEITCLLSPEEAYLRATKLKEGILFETNESDSGYTFICPIIDKYLSGNEGTLKRFEEEIKKINLAPNNDPRPYIGGGYGNLGYDTIRDFEVIPNTNPETLGIPDSNIFICNHGIVFNQNNNTVYLTSIAKTQGEADSFFKVLEDLLEGPTPTIETEFSVGKFSSTPSKEKYLQNVLDGKEYIKNGDIFQVVLSQRFTQESNLDPFLFYKKLKKLNPSPYMYFLNFGKFQLIGSSPERLLALDKGVLKTVPIAGTTKRGETPEEDNDLIEKLLNNEKELAEHRMLIDLARNDLARVSKPESVVVTEAIVPKKFSHVTHLVSLVESVALHSTTPFSAIGSILPAGTLSGAPKIRAMEIIEEAEEVRRTFYGGGVGYINYSGSMDFCITIRSAIHKDGVYSYQAGAGIVADSDPESEYQECINKGMSITKIFAKEGR